MDRELAQAVLERFSDGEPVYEGTLYKAAEALGLDPDTALGEARFASYFGSYLIEKQASGRPMTLGEKLYFSVAAGVDLLELTKTASLHGLGDDQLIVRLLAERGLVPDLEKLANMGMLGGPPGGGQDAGQDPAQQAEAQPPPMEPQPGAQVQAPPPEVLQNMPEMAPGPTAPQGQVPASDDGNLAALLQGAQQADAAPMGGGLPPAGMGAQETPPPPSAADKINQVFQGQLDPDTVQRYAGELEKFEQQLGMSVQDPKQIEKFIKEIQKTEKKQVDEAIKQYGEQKQQEMAAATGQGSPKIDNTAPKPLGPSGLSAGSPASGQAEAMAKLARAAQAMARGHVGGI